MSAAQAKPVAGGWSTTAQVATASEELAGWVAGQFRGRLSGEEARDVAWETILEAREELGSGRVRCAEAFLRRAARHNALDAVRKRDGYQASGPRPLPVSFDADRHAPPVEDELGTSVDQRVRDLQAVMAAVGELPELERQAITLRHVDGLNPQTCQLLLGVSHRRWRRLHPRALRLLREALAAAGTSADCRRTRLLLDQGLLAPALAIRRDAHLDDCVSCRAHRHLLDADPLERLGRSIADPATGA